MMYITYVEVPCSMHAGLCNVYQYTIIYTKVESVLYMYGIQYWYIVVLSLLCRKARLSQALSFRYKPVYYAGRSYEINPG